MDDTVLLNEDYDTTRIDHMFFDDISSLLHKSDELHSSLFHDLLQIFSDIEKECDRVHIL